MNFRPFLPLTSVVLTLVSSLALAAPRDRAPSVFTIPNATVPLGSGLGFAVRASDPDGETITSLTAADLPAGSTFTLRDATNTQGDLSWDPVSEGNFFPIFTACNALCGSAKVFLTSCVGCSVAYLSTVGSNQSLKLSGGANNTWCVQIEPDFFHDPASQILPASIVLHSDGTGSTTQIGADPSSTGTLGDRSNNGIQEMTACFARGDLQNLFGNVTAPTTAYVTVSGSFVGGGTFLGNLVLSVSP